LKTGLPGIVGALDGSHIRLASCPRGDTDYINRKGFPSMQLQVLIVTVYAWKTKLKD